MLWSSFSTSSPDTHCPNLNQVNFYSPYNHNDSNFLYAMHGQECYFTFSQSGQIYIINGKACVEINFNHPSRNNLSFVCIAKLFR
jgi:hypothetical protein